MKDFKIGDRVCWNYLHGYVTGTIIKIITSEIPSKQYITQASRSYTVHASPEEPQYLIKTDTTEVMVIHKGSALKKISQK